MSVPGSKIPSTVPDSTHLPRILCLHGGGVNAIIFKAQARALIRHLQHSFRLVWADGPFICEPHKDVITVYGSYGPFRRWMRWLPEHTEIDDESCIDEIAYSIRNAMQADDREGGRGEWVGLMGFSQGSKLTSSLLLEQQAREDKALREGKKEWDTGMLGIPGLKWRFGVLMAGSAPIANLIPELLSSPALARAAEPTLHFKFPRGAVDEEAICRRATIHVHGLTDPGLPLHERLFNDYHHKDSRTLIEWEGAHRVPIKSNTVERVVGAMYEVAEKEGVKVTWTVDKRSSWTHAED